MITGEEEPDAGTLRIGETVELGYIDQSRDALADDKTVWEEISNGEDIIFLGDKQMQSRAYCGAFNFRGADQQKKVGQLSGGERNRVHLAKMLKSQANVLLLDEPLGALDKKLREQTQFELVNIQEKVGTTFVMVTHDQEEAMTMASRIAVMNEGVINQTGTPFELYEYPNSRYTANFLGQVNLIEGVLVDDDEKYAVIKSDEAGCEIYIDHAVQGHEGMTFWVALRPERLRITKEAPKETKYNCVSGKVEEIGYLGGISTYHVRLESGKRIKVTEPNSTRQIEPRYTWEDTVWVSWEAGAASVLNK